ncbi:ACP S-malonyltransferase [Gottfriedia luciferensis]|uniref:ACP S-malonyltransferase n=1 Tax=Gottfriedia luciferensis TaxID=178774 RepID=UPI000B446346|nr:ACP S-malonyltransferase [Gottfriedia luciferensis]
MGKVAFIFPGQGSQKVGMGKDLAESFKECGSIFETANEQVGFNLSDIIFNGNDEELTVTYHAQPAILTTSIAMLEKIKEAGIKPDYVAGHSLGEFTALVAAEAISFEDGVKLVHKRGQLMEQAVPVGQGAMAAVLFFAPEKIEEVISEVNKKGHSVGIANYNSPTQVVITGDAEGVQIASGLIKEAGAKRVLPLKVSGPFHSSLMQPASEEFQNELNKINVNDCATPLISNVTANVITDANDIKELLVKQLFSPVKWNQSIQELVELGVDTFVEIGPGKVLTGLVKAISPSAKLVNVYDVETLNQFLNEWEEMKTC